jgi:acyl carrier protein
MRRSPGRLRAFRATEGGEMEPIAVRNALKELMIAELNLEGKTPADIDDAAPLFGEGLGLDSLDALQLAMSVEERFGVRIPEGEEARSIFASVDALVDHIVRARAAA